MAVDVHGGRDVLVAQPFLCDLYMDILEQHDGCAKMSQVMETASGKVSLLKP